MSDQLDLFGAERVQSGQSELPEGVILLRGFLDLDEQISLLASCRGWAKNPSGIYRPKTASGLPMKVQFVCLGWHWSHAFGYSKERIDHDRQPVKPMPPMLWLLSRRAIQFSGRDYPGYEPDVAIVNYFSPDASLSLHQDDSEKSSAPIVTFSLGDSAVFKIGHNGSRSGPFVSVTLESGDAIIMGWESRMRFHAIAKILPNTAPRRLDMKQPGRLSITVRETGM